MSQKWTDKEHVIRTADIDPGALGSGSVTIPASSKGGRPFRVTSIVADASECFRLVQGYAGDSRMLEKKDGAVFPVTGLFATAEPGGVVEIEVKNVSSERRSFSGKLVGKELAD